MVLEEFLKPLGMTQTEFAQRIGVAWTRANQIIKGRRSVTPDTALRLERLFGMPADFWLTLQHRWDLYHALRSPGAKELAKIKLAPGIERLAKSA
jgi:addiction module HigA family antidote